MEVIKLNDISKSFGDKVVFNKFNLSVQEGDFLCITGDSGKGKSTLLNMIGLLEKPDSGKINILGFENPEINSKSGVELLRSNISYLFQNYGLVDNETVEYNLKISTRFLKLSKEEKNTKMVEALKTVGLSGYEKKKIYQLSGGEQQRVAIAGILLKPTSIILADEPTGSLDSRNRDLVMSLLTKINSLGTTVIIVTHDEKVVKCGKKIIEL
ncbi:MAG TPA: putative bacteriocin export ABC transporter [Clostridiales bacterium]|nr:putative bacteriocin export ABC transporter [Clostridiales bacterium]